MRILFIWDSDYPWDVRVEKVCRSLLRADHEVHLVCRNKLRRPRNEVDQSLHIHRLPALSRVFGSLNSAFTFPFFMSPIWLREISERARQYDCQLIIVRDLPMAPAAVWVGRQLGIPVVLDMAECYPELLRATWRFERFRFANLVVRNPCLADRLESWVVHRVDQIWVMVEESRDRLMAMGVPEGKIRIVGNTPEIRRYERSTSVAAKGVDALQLVYVGLLNPSRGLETALRAVALAARAGAAVQLSIIGTGKAESSLRALAQSLELEQNIIFRGWMHSSFVPAAIGDADVGLVPHHICSHWNNTIPNKLFDYMAAAKPVIVSSAKPVARIVQETNSGLIYPDNDASVFAEHIRALTDSNLRAQLGRNGRAAVDAKYRWDNDERVLLEGIMSLAHEISRLRV